MVFRVLSLVDTKPASSSCATPEGGRDRSGLGLGFWRWTSGVCACVVDQLEMAAGGGGVHPGPTNESSVYSSAWRAVFEFIACALGMGIEFPSATISWGRCILPLPGNLVMCTVLPVSQACGTGLGRGGS